MGGTKGAAHFLVKNKNKIMHSLSAPAHINLNSVYLGTVMLMLFIEYTKVVVQKIMFFSAFSISGFSSTFPRQQHLAAIALQKVGS